jgi:MoaA/NifB/PqqE/SkfB family radical SAM enzyme
MEVKTLLTGIHFLLTYMCNLKCDHCFIYSGPNAKGTFTLNQIQSVLNEAAKINTIEWIYFEGGEPFLYYPLMLEGIRIARSMGFKVGVVTNGYYATSEEDAELWLGPLAKLGVSDLSISNDSFHWGEEEDNPAKKALAAAKRLGLSAASICISKPTLKGIDNKQGKGSPIIDGGSKFRGRAVENLVEGLPKKHWVEFTECPYENLAEPGRVHIDSYGNIHLCQGLSMGNIWETPLSALVKKYEANSHPICGPLANGGPALLAKEYNVKHEDKYVDACHFCYTLRLALIDKFPQYLAPKQVYGLE